MISAMGAYEVAELQGLDGAFTFPEKLLQKLWLRGDFNRQSAVLCDGRKLRVIHPGKWNLLGGPDFAGARLRFDDGPEMTGAVELHLRIEDWVAHRHAEDPAYDGVILHVVLFEPEPGRAATWGGTGAEIPVLVLLPLLHRALEEYAADEAVEVLANRAAARLPDELGTLPPSELQKLLRRYARQRWQQKVRFARMRISRLGWDDACHHTALEILGYRFNRAPMLRVATTWPLNAWQDAALTPESVYEAERESWSLQGVRPANHPRVRLRQYAAWVQSQPKWPQQLETLAKFAPLLVSDQQGEKTRCFRRRVASTDARDEVRRRICGENLGGTRFETMCCDGWWPLLAAQTDAPTESAWYHWFVGDLPPLLLSGLRQLGYFDGRSQAACHGAAQGLLGWLLEREARH